MYTFLNIYSLNHYSVVLGAQSLSAPKQNEFFVKILVSNVFKRKTKNAQK